MSDLENNILQHVAHPNYRPVKPRVIAKKLGVGEDHLPHFKRTLKRLVKRGLLAYGASHLVLATAATSRGAEQVDGPVAETAAAEADGNGRFSAAEDGSVANVEDGSVAAAEDGSFSDAEDGGSADAIDTADDEPPSGKKGAAKKAPARNRTSAPRPLIMSSACFAGRKRASASCVRRAPSPAPIASSMCSFPPIARATPRAATRC